MMKKHSSLQRKISITVFGAVMAAILGYMVYLGVYVERELGEYVSRRAITELRGTALEQESLIKREMEQQFAPLYALKDCFADDEDRTVSGKRLMHAYFASGTWQTIGYADTDGRPFEIEGEKPEDIREIKAFTEVAAGEADYGMERLETLPFTANPRFILTIPVHKDGKTEGVLFGITKILSLADILQANEDENDHIFVIDSEGNILFGNNSALCQASANLSYTKALLDTEIAGKSLREVLSDGERGEVSFNSDHEEWVEYLPLGIQDWNLLVVADRTEKVAKYSADAAGIHRSVHRMTRIFSLLFLLISALGIGVYAVILKGRSAYVFQKKCNETMIRSLECEFFVFDVKKRTVKTEGVLHEEFGMDLERDINETVESQQRLHPECDFSKIRSLMNEAVLYNEKREITVPFIHDKAVRWVKLLLVPYTAENGRVTHVFGSFMNVTQEHELFERKVEMLENTPGGFHRCYLSEPIHLEYVSDGLCRMLGYTREELQKVIKGDDYSLLIDEKDRVKFEEYCKRLSLMPGVETCEYQMICKDGKRISVSDTMESVLSPEGIMYGYSAVYDITDQQLQLENLNKELTEARYKNSLSQMQPHFLYNALASIREIILYDPEYASELTLDFTTHLRACIRAMATNNLISIKDELNNIKAYVNIEKMRFGEKLKVEYDIECAEFEIVPLSIQPLVENAIRHGVYERGAEGGTVVISTRKEKDFYIVSVKDDGVGFDYEKVKEEIDNGSRDSTGLSSLIFRLQKMMNATVDIESYKGTGTVVTVKIPMEYKKSGGGLLNNEDYYR